MTMRLSPDRVAWFTVPPGSDATAPPERRGVARDGVRLLVARDRHSARPHIEHLHFRALPSLLRPGDLVLVNTSATMPAALKGRREDDRAAVVHLSTVLDGGDWVVEIRRPDGSGPETDVVAGETLDLPDAVPLHLEAAYPDPMSAKSRLWRAEAGVGPDVAAYLARNGGPIRYGYLDGLYPLVDHQTVFATSTPPDGGAGSAEMPSAGRPFTAPLVVELVANGVTIAPVVLHAGVSSPEMSEPPLPERFEVPKATARLINGARSNDHRVVAIGTTVARAVESAAAPDGVVEPARGWTDLVLGPDRPARTLTGLVTGLHAPDASHLLLLEAVAGPTLVQTAYAAAVERRYLWHEFGDSMLFLP